MSEYIANKVITIIWPYNSIVVSKSRWKDATADSARKLHKKRPKKRITLKWLKKVVLKKMKIVSNKRVTSRSPTPPPPPIALLQDKYISFLPKKCENRVFSLTWPASMQIVWNKRKRLHKKGVQLPQDWFGTPTWPPFHCFGTPIWAPWRHVKTLYWTIHLRNYFTHCARRGRAGLGTKDVLNQPWFTQNVVVMDLVISLTQNLFLDPPLPQANSCLFLVRWWYKC